MTFNDGLLTFNHEIAKQIADRRGTRKFLVLFRFSDQSCVTSLWKAILHTRIMHCLWRHMIALK